MQQANIYVTQVSRALSLTHTLIIPQQLVRHIIRQYQEELLKLHCAELGVNSGVDQSFWHERDMILSDLLHILQSIPRQALGEKGYGSQNPLLSVQLSTLRHSYTKYGSSQHHYLTSCCLTRMLDFRQPAHEFRRHRRSLVSLIPRRSLKHTSVLPRCPLED